MRGPVKAQTVENSSRDGSNATRLRGGTSLLMAALLALGAITSTLALRDGDEVDMPSNMPMVAAETTRPTDDSAVPGDHPPVAPSSGESEIHNAAPVIAGEPPRFVMQGAPYLFEPDAYDFDSNEALTFGITGMPDWAKFEPRTGAIMGVPQEEDVGRYEGIAITVSDGVNTASIEFSIDVVASATGAALIQWTPPADTVDGSPFPGIRGYRIDYGQSPYSLLQSVNIDGVGVTSYVVENLTPGPWYFQVVVYDQDGLESEASTLVEKIVE